MFLKELRDEGMRQDSVNPVLSISTMHYFLSPRKLRRGEVSARDV